MTYPVKITSQHPLGENLKENQAIWKMNVLYTEKKKSFPHQSGDDFFFKYKFLEYVRVKKRSTFLVYMKVS